MPAQKPAADFERVLRELLVGILGEPLPDFTDRTHLADQLGLSSLQVVTLAEELERRLGMGQSGRAYSVTELVRIGDLRKIASPSGGVEPRTNAPDPLAASLARGAERRRARQRRR